MGTRERTRGSNAAQRVTRAANLLWSAVSPGDEVRGPRDDLHPFVDQELRRAVNELTRAEDLLAPGIGQPDVSEGMRQVREASDAIEATRGLVSSMPHDVVVARADALRLLDALTGR